MENLKTKNTNSTNTITQFMNDNNYQFISSSKSILTNKQKFINSINKEIKVMSERDNLELESVNGRLENRFHVNVIDDIVRFNFKYKGKIVILPNQNTNKLKNGSLRVSEYLMCENNIEKYIDVLNNWRDVFNMIDENDEFFNQLS
jgi:NCAIR mutase (PurE)-related protein